MNISLDQLAQVCRARSRAALAQILPELNRAFDAAQCVTHLRAAMMLAQVAHESGEFRYLEELADGSRYEGRADLGNTQPGDGPRFKGRGWLQITGRSNYAAAGAALGLDLIGSPELAATVPVAASTAAWFWRSHRGLNDAGDVGNVITATRIVNGGTNGLQQRTEYYNRAIVALAGSHDPGSP